MRSRYLTEGMGNISSQRHRRGITDLSTLSHPRVTCLGGHEPLHSRPHVAEVLNTQAACGELKRERTTRPMQYENVPVNAQVLDIRVLRLMPT